MGIEARRLVMALLVMWCTTAWAAPTSVYLEELTWTEVRDAVSAGATTVIVPIGGTEQNGPHMVLGKHNVRAHVLAGRIAGALGNALVAPVIAYVPEGGIDPPTGHMRFPGTISIPPDTFVATLEGAARSLATAGFRDIVFLGDHGGYRREEQRAAERLNRAWGRRGPRAHAIDEYYRATETTFVQLLEARGFGQKEIGVHAGLADTALALAIDPRLVRQDRLRLASEVGSGVQGDPRRASADTGQLGVDAIVSASVEAIRHAAAPRPR